LCGINGTSGIVAYGANGKFIFEKFAVGSSVVCNNSTFSQDPAVNIPKNCFAPALPIGYYSLCANEGGYCSFGGTANVVYGANGRFFLENFSNGTLCNNTVFREDPAPGIYKGCLIPTGPVMPNFIFCSQEGATCVPGDPALTTAVAYGVNNTFLIIPSHGGAFNCSNKEFGIDPVPGIVKACFYLMTFL
jgi:hypothetical protein